MSRPIGRPRSDKPKYCLDKPSGRAFVTLAGKKKYLGLYDTPQIGDKSDRRASGGLIARQRRVRRFFADARQEFLLGFGEGFRTGIYAQQGQPQARGRSIDVRGVGMVEGLKQLLGFDAGTCKPVYPIGQGDGGVAGFAAIASRIVTLCKSGRGRRDDASPAGAGFPFRV